MPFRRPKPLVGRRTTDDLINAESALGRTIFGPVPKDYPREFFHYQNNIWIWHENGLTTRYEVRPTGVFKKSPDGKYHQIQDAELANFRTAARTYLTLIKSQLYH